LVKKPRSLNLGSAGVSAPTRAAVVGLEIDRRKSSV